MGRIHSSSFQTYKEVDNTHATAHNKHTTCHTCNGTKLTTQGEQKEKREDTSTASTDSCLRKGQAIVIQLMGVKSAGL